MSKHTEDEYRAMGLTEDEIEAMMEDDDQGDGDEGGDGNADDDDAGAGAGGGADGAATGASNDGAQGGDQGGNAGAGGAGAGGADDGTAGTAQSGAGAAPPPPAAPPAAPQPNPRLSEIETGLSTLEQQFDDGELTASEFRQQQKALLAEQDDLRWQERSQQLRADMAHEQRVAHWTGSVQSFLSRPDMAQFYNPTSPGLPFNALNQAVIARQEAARASGGNDIDPAIMEQAHADVLAQFRIGTTAAAPVDDAATGAAAPPARKPAPLSLANVPASAGTETSDQRWANLDRLADNPDPEDPDAYEREFAKLSPDQQSAYLAAR